MFAATTLIAVSFSIGSFRIGETERPFLYAVLLWIILVFSALSGLSRSFVKEEEAGTMDVLRLSARPQAVFLGKLFFNLTLLAALEVVIVPSFILIMEYNVAFPGFFVAMVISAGLGLGAGTTIVAAMIARASARGALFAALSFPLLFPLMITAIKGCERAALGMDAAGWPEVSP
jgi:heme exporter protein B